MNAPPEAIRFNPADYFTFVFDQEIRKAGMPGGYCGFALELAAEPDLALIRQRLKLLRERFPVASALPEQRGKRWFWCPTGAAIPFEQLYIETAEAAQLREAAVAVLNRPGPLQSTLPLALYWIAGNRGGLLLLRWIHPLLDARGAKIVLDFLSAQDPDRYRDSPSLIEAKLAQWSFWQTAKLYLKAKRHNGKANRLYSCLPTAVEQGTQELRLRIRTFTEDQTRRIATLAMENCGAAGKSVYSLACLMRAMELAQPPVAKAGYCIPYAFNLRKQNAPTPVFGNHVSCLFAQATREQVGDRQALLNHLLTQYRKTVANELDYAYLPLMWLGQWLSPARYGELLRKQKNGGELSSVWFSDVGEVRWDKAGFFGVPVTGMFHLSWITLPPGLAVLIGQSNGRLTLSYNYLSPAIDEGWLARLMARMDAELLDSSP